MNTQDMPQLLDTIDAAKILGVSRFTVVRWIHGDGVDTALPAKKFGRGYRITGKDLHAWIYGGDSQAA